MNNNKFLIVFNPKAGFRYIGNYKKYFIKNFKKYLPQTNYYWLRTSKKLERQLEKINFNEFKRVIVIGGDGTVKIVADHILKNNLTLPLAIIPQGTANVLASSLNIPLIQKLSIKTACLGREKRIDVGLLNNMYYFFAAITIGFLAKVIKETKRGLKIKLGFFAYLLTFLKQKKVYRADFNFKIDGKKYNTKGNTFIIANALSLFKLKTATPIDFYDGKFDILITKNKSFLGFITVLFFLFFSKKWLPAVFKSQGKKIEIEYTSNKKKTIQIDGENIAVDKIKVEIIPNKLRIITQ